MGKYVATKFNPLKCKVMHLLANENPCNEYSLNGVTLKSVDSEKDLGVTISNRMSFDEHIKNSLTKSNKIIAWISRNIICKSKDVMILIYKCLK